MLIKNAIPEGKILEFLKILKITTILIYFMPGLLYLKKKFCKKDITLTMLL